MINTYDDTERRLPLHYYCKFCNRTLSRPYPLTSFNENDYECKDCDTLFELNKDGLSIRAMYITNGNYYADFEPDVTFQINLGISDPNYHETTIISLPYWPDNITPSNLLDKAKLYTTFQ